MTIPRISSVPKIPEVSALNLRKRQRESHLGEQPHATPYIAKYIVVKKQLFLDCAVLPHTQYKQINNTCLAPYLPFTNGKHFSSLTAHSNYTGREAAINKEGAQEKNMHPSRCLKLP